MKVTDIFGTHLRPTHEYVGWLHTKEGKDWMIKHAVRVSTRDTRDWLIEEAHTILSQPNSIHDFVKPEESEEVKQAKNCKCDMSKYCSDEWTPCPLGDRQFNECLTGDMRKAGEKYQPLYKGEWRVTDTNFIAIRLEGKEKFRILGKITDWETRNDFATHCFKEEGIPLELDEEYEI